MLLSICAVSNLHIGDGQTEGRTEYSDPGNKFKLLYPTNWKVSTRHVDISGFTEVTISNPNSTRMKISVVYTPKDSLLASNGSKSVLASMALANLEKDISPDYFFFNSTGKFPHKYVIKGHDSASDLIDYEKIKGQPGRMVIVLAKVTDQDSIVFTYSEAKGRFYKFLSNASQIVNSISIS